MYFSVTVILVFQQKMFERHKIFKQNPKFDFRKYMALCKGTRLKGFLKDRPSVKLRPETFTASPKVELSAASMYREFFSSD